MKKLLLPLLIILLLTGCSKIDTKTTEYSSIVNTVLSNSNKSVNTASVGYKYYTPVGVNLVYDNEANKKFKIRDTNIFLYVDIISYYYKNNLNYDEIENNNFYSSKFSDGFISISKENELYFLKIVYNYAKIEAYVKEKDLVDIISYSTIILNSIDYNDNLINNLIEKGITFEGSITYEIKKPDDSESKFSQYLQEYVQENTEDETVVLPEE